MFVLVTVKDISADTGLTLTKPYCVAVEATSTREAKKSAAKSIMESYQESIGSSYMVFDLKTGILSVTKSGMPEKTLILTTKKITQEQYQCLSELSMVLV